MVTRISVLLLSLSVLAPFSLRSEPITYRFYGSIRHVFLNIDGVEYDETSTVVQESEYYSFLNSYCNYVFEVDTTLPGILQDETGISFELEDEVTEYYTMDYFYNTLASSTLLDDSIGGDDLTNQYFGLNYSIAFTEEYGTSLFSGPYSHYVVVANYYNPSISTWGHGTWVVGTEYMSISPNVSVTLSSDLVLKIPQPDPEPEPVPEAEFAAMLIMGCGVLSGVYGAGRRASRRN